MADLYGPNFREVTAKVIEGEAIVINLNTGDYYSLVGAGALVWECIEARLNVDAIADCVAEHYDVERDVIERDLAAVLTQLRDESLIVEAEGDAAATPPAPAEAKSTYAAPILECFRDMSDLLALDPPVPGIVDSLVRGEPDAS